MCGIIHIVNERNKEIRKQIKGLHGCKKLKNESINEYCSVELLQTLRRR